MADRPAIPPDIDRQIRTESGDRCAVCGESSSLDLHHIIPWAKVKEHKAENLICLCANCHRLAHNKKWEKEKLYYYKLNPWIKTRSITEPNVEIELTLDMELDQFDKTRQEQLKEVLATFTDIPNSAVKIKAIIRNSVLAVIEMPKQAAEKVLFAFEKHDEFLLTNLVPFKVISIRKLPMYVGTIVGESTSREFRLAAAPGAVREQDIIAVDAELSDPEKPDVQPEEIRVWAKVQSIERLNPLFPQEAGHELAETQTDPFDTVLSLSREMVTALCQVLGSEPLSGGKGGKLDQLRYPPKPATRAYRPNSSDIARIVLGDLGQKQNRALDIATLANRPEVDVKVDGHAIVTRHLAILAMTGAGKSWTARRIIEQLAGKNYPIVIFDPHGDYTGLADVPLLEGKVKRYFAQFPVFEEDADTVSEIVSALGYELNPNMKARFDDVFDVAKSFLIDDAEEMRERIDMLAKLLGRANSQSLNVQQDLWLVANLAEAGELVLRGEDKKKKGEISSERQQLIDLGWDNFNAYSKTDARTLEAVKKRTRSAAKVLQRMERTNRKAADSAVPLPTNRTELVRYGGISVISLAGYTGDFQATIYSLIADAIFEARINENLKLPVLLLLEEAHNFVPAKANSPAEARSIETTKQIAQEGRKFGVGLILISQRPSRLDETTLSQCNSFVIMRLVNPADQNFVKQVIESLGEDEAKMLPDLDVGEALLSGQMINFPVLVKIKEPESKGEREEEDAFMGLEEAYKEMTNQKG